MASTRGPEEKKDYSRGPFRHARVLVLAVDILGWFCPPVLKPKLSTLLIPATVYHTWEHSPSIGWLFLSSVNCLERLAVEVKVNMR